MKLVVQGCILAACLLPPILLAQQPGREAKVQYRAPKLTEAMFLEGVMMLPSEQDDYASNLAAYAVGMILNRSDSVSAMENGRRALALALHLSPRNRKAVVANFQLAKGILPKPIDSDYTPKVFARLLVTRGQLLIEADGDKNKLLAGAFVTLAAEMDPLNEDAVFASELHRIEHGTFDWNIFTGL